MIHFLNIVFLEGPLAWQSDCFSPFSGQSDNMMHVMENAVQNGLPVLLQDIYESVDPALEAILSKSYIQRGANVSIPSTSKQIPGKD